MKKTRIGQYLLIAGGMLNAAVGILHIGIVFWGPPAYRFFGAGEDMALQAEAGSIVPAIATSCLAVVFMAFACYAFSAAGWVRRLPFLRTVVVGIGIVYVLRGVLMIPMAAVVWIQRNMLVEGRDIVFSAVAALIGVLYLIGMRMETAFLKRTSANDGGV